MTLHGAACEGAGMERGVYMAAISLYAAREEVHV